MLSVSDLKQLRLLGKLSEKHLSALARVSDKRVYERKSHVYEKGDRATRLFGVSKGLVSLRDIQPGDIVGISYEICESGQLFGIAALIESEKYSLTAVCLKDSEVIAIDGEKLLEFCQEYCEFGYSFMLMIAQLYFDRYQHAKKQLYSIVREPTIITALPG